jgi:hypothetical protein
MHITADSGNQVRRPRWALGPRVSAGLVFALVRRDVYFFCLPVRRGHETFRWRGQASVEQLRTRSVLSGVERTADAGQRIRPRAGGHLVGETRSWRTQ